MIAALTWMSHSQNLRRMAREHPIDLYMQPPVTRFRLLDYHLMDRIVRDSNRCASLILPSLKGASSALQRIFTWPLLTDAWNSQSMLLISEIILHMCLASSRSLTSRLYHRACPKVVALCLKAGFVSLPAGMHGRLSLSGSATRA